MNKLIHLGIIFLAVVAGYIILAVIMPAINEVTAVAADSINASTNMSNFPGTLEVVQSSPWWLWSLPGIAGVIAAVVMLRKQEV